MAARSAVEGAVVFLSTIAGGVLPRAQLQRHSQLPLLPLLLLRRLLFRLVRKRQPPRLRRVTQVGMVGALLLLRDP